MKKEFVTSCCDRPIEDCPGCPQGMQLIPKDKGSNRRVSKNMTKAAMLKKALGFPAGNMDYMGLNEYQNNTGWNSWNALGPMGHGFPAGGLSNAFGGNPYATQPNIQGNEAIMQSQQQLNNTNMLGQNPQLGNYMKQANKEEEDNEPGFFSRNALPLGAAIGVPGGIALGSYLRERFGNDYLSRAGALLGEGVDMGADAVGRGLNSGIEALQGGVNSLANILRTKSGEYAKQPEEKYAAQDSQKTQRSATGEDNGVSYKLRDADHATGSSAWDSLSEFRKISAAQKQAQNTQLYLKEAGLTEFQAGFFGKLIDRGVPFELFGRSVEKVAAQIGDDLCAELLEADLDGLQKLAQQMPQPQMPQPPDPPATGKPLPLPQQPLQPPQPPQPPAQQGSNLLGTLGTAGKYVGNAVLSNLPVIGPMANVASAVGGEQAKDLAQKALPYFQGVGDMGVPPGPSSAGPGKAPAGPAKPPAVPKPPVPQQAAPKIQGADFYDNIMQSDGTFGKGVSDFSSAIGADYMIDAVLGEGASARMHPLLKVLMLAGGGMGIGGLLSGNRNMGLGGLGLAALPLLMQGTQGFGMLREQKPVQKVDYQPNEFIDSMWADGKIDPDELNQVIANPGQMMASVGHEDFNPMMQQIINQTYTGDEANPSFGDQLLAMQGAPERYRPAIAAALAKAPGESTYVGPPFLGQNVPGMGVDEQRALYGLSELNVNKPQR